MFKKFFAVCFFFILSFSSFCFAENSVNPMNLPKLTQFVNDFSNSLSQDQLTELNKIAKDYETKTTNQILVVLFPNRNGKELADIGLKVFRDNQIGQKGKNNGLLLLISTEEKKIRIVTGYGLEGDIPDVLASDIIEKDIRPAVNESKIYDGIKNYYNRVIKALDTGEGKKIQDEQNYFGGIFTVVIGCLFGLIAASNFSLFLIFFIFFVTMSVSTKAFSLLAGFLIGSIIRIIMIFSGFPKGPKNKGGSSWWTGGGSSGGSSGGGDFGGFSGGGGSSGGGGAGD
ncbi:MAG: TPM domain-containing protein [Candidatus Gracilibacteria bacterium]|nr:TPM domain-containing protein [Candidatus Gracilibacteria bacterium]MDD3120144.1 TPM domain-containing protein [Candidatus Gracilibacteria bacterium]MDD4530362.1 TPM domain-containing protein [Candidatus Gracilibacteria bacterium]